MNSHPALNSSAALGYKCADCTMDSEPCPVCYRVWWQLRHPNTTIVCADDSALFAAEQRAAAFQMDAERYRARRMDDYHSLALNNLPKGHTTDPNQHHQQYDAHSDWLLKPDAARAKEAK